MNTPRASMVTASGACDPLAVMFMMANVPMRETCFVVVPFFGTELVRVFLILLWPLLTLALPAWLS